MARYLNPKSDLGFKRIFGEHPKLLQSFLNAVLPLPQDCLIERLEYLSPENVPEIRDFKYSIVDVRCFDNHGRHFIVEMQMEWSKHFIQRMFYNGASAYVKQLKHGEAFKKLSPVYGLALIDEVFSKKEEWFHHFKMLNVEDSHGLLEEPAAGDAEQGADGAQQRSVYGNTRAASTGATQLCASAVGLRKKSNDCLEDIQLIFIELPKLQPTGIAQKKLALLWLRFLKEMNEKTEVIDASFLEVEPIKEAVALLEKGAYTEAELQAYDRYLDAIRTEITLMEDNFDEGLEQGRAEGRAEELQKFRSLLERQLKRRFANDFTEKHLHLISKADGDQLAQWSENLMDAATIDQVLG